MRNTTLRHKLFTPLAAISCLLVTTSNIHAETDAEVIDALNAQPAALTARLIGH